MKMVFVFGTKNSGKTAVAESLVLGLTRRGLKVGALKHIHHEFTLDTEGKDTYRMRKAGAQLVVSLSPSEIAMLRAPGDTDDEFRALSGQMVAEGFDFLIAEGFKIMSARLPSVFRILTCRTTAELDSLIPEIRPNVDCISGVISSTIEGASYRGLPVVKFPEQTERLLRMVTA
jgi:molybdopterin-guanine dinucleotide biosynthesis protein MobB